jgi:hypothetical protein
MNTVTKVIADNARAGYFVDLHLEPKSNPQHEEALLIRTREALEEFYSIYKSEPHIEVHTKINGVPARAKLTPAQFTAARFPEATLPENQRRITFQLDNPNKEGHVISSSLSMTAHPSELFQFNRETLLGFRRPTPKPSQPKHFPRFISGIKKAASSLLKEARSLAGKQN